VHWAAATLATALSAVTLGAVHQRGLRTAPGTPSNQSVRSTPSRCRSRHCFSANRSLTAHFEARSVLPLLPKKRARSWTTSSNATGQPRGLYERVNCRTPSRRRSKPQGDCNLTIYQGLQARRPSRRTELKVLDADRKIADVSCLQLSSFSNGWSGRLISHARSANTHLILPSKSSPARIRSSKPPTRDAR
jgi:hypothetical protein